MGPSTRRHFVQELTTRTAGELRGSKVSCRIALAALQALCMPPTMEAATGNALSSAYKHQSERHTAERELCDNLEASAEAVALAERVCTVDSVR